MSSSVENPEVLINALTGKVGTETKMSGNPTYQEPTTRPSSPLGG